MLQLTKVSFSGHETFPFRAGWLKKGLWAVQRYGHRIFADEDEAMTRLGVGKNMVRSIRHWCLATGILEELVDDGRRLIATSLGDSLLQDNGFDPYLEDIGTLWLIHWHLATNKEKATTWYAVLSDYSEPDLTKEKLTSFLSEKLKDNGITHIADVSLERDVNVFIRTYVPAKNTNTKLLEESLDCPLIELNLISALADGKTYQLNRGGHPTLPDLVLAYMIAEYWSIHAQHSKTLSFEDLMYKPGSPGRITRLQENAMVERLDRMATVTRGAFYFNSTNGLRQLYQGRRELTSPWDLLSDYYSGLRRGDQTWPGHLRT